MPADTLDARVLVTIVERGLARAVDGKGQLAGTSCNLSQLSLVRVMYKNLFLSIDSDNIIFIRYPPFPTTIVTTW
jgi:hypothetical protein